MLAITVYSLTSFPCFCNVVINKEMFFPMCVCVGVWVYVWVCGCVGVWVWVWVCECVCVSVYVSVCESNELAHLQKRYWGYKSYPGYMMACCI